MDETLVEDGPSYKRLAVKLNEYEGHKLLDIRYWYLHKKSGEYRGTRKGIALKAPQYKLLTRALVENTESILAWLEEATVPEHVFAYTQRQQDAVEKLLSIGGQVSASTMPWPRDPRFFNVKHSGDLDHVVFNSESVFIQNLEAQLEGAKGEDAIWAIFGRLFSTFRQARVRLSDAPAIDPDALFDQLELEWARLLEGSMEGLL